MPPRRRVRKRKQRNVSASSSSSSSSSASDDEITPKIAPQPVVESASEESDTDSSSAISSAAATTIPLATVSKKPTQDERVPSRSPSPPIANIPPMFPPSADGPSEKERALKEKFKKLWMASLADTFKDELEQIRKEPNLTTSRLSLLIDALASGADVYASEENDNHPINEMEMVLGNSELREQ